jgi:hypothetical protein
LWSVSGKGQTTEDDRLSHRRFDNTGILVRLGLRAQLSRIFSYIGPTTQY